MPLLILLVIVTTTLTLFLMLQTRRAFWRRAGLAYIAVVVINLTLALNLWTVPQPVRTLTIAVLILATLFLLPTSILTALRRGAAQTGPRE